MTMFKYSKYIAGASPVHMINPVLKLIVTILYIISAFLAKTLMAYLFLMVFLLIVLIFTYISDSRYYKHIYDYKWLIVAVLILDLIINFSLKSLALSLISALFSVLMIGAYIFTTKPRDTFVILRVLFSPFKLFGLDPEKMAFKLMSVSVYKPIFKEEKQKTLKELKNLDKEIGFFDKVKIAHKNAIGRIEKLSETMIIRNYFVYGKETYRNKIKANDCLLVVAEFVLLIAIIIRG